MAGNDGSFFGELKRRNVYRVGIAYAIASWLILQVIDVVEPIIGIPEWVPKLILVLLAVGLPLVLFFSWAYEMTPEGIKRERDVDRSASITPQTGRRLDRLIIGVLIVAVAVMAVDQYLLPERNTTPGDATVAAAAVEPEEITSTAAPSIAVLPFANMSADESSTYFSDGLADTLLHMLAQIREIRVAARTSSFQFRDQNTDITRIAEALNVGTVLEGSVQRAGNKIRVTAQLIEAETGYHLWSGNFDRDLDDVFAIQDEIANEVVAALKVSLLGESTQKLATHETDSVEAYTEYLLAINDRNEYSVDSLRRAEERFRNAVRIDPDYALAWAQLASLYVEWQGVGIGAAQEDMDMAQEAASRALELDAESALAITVLGSVEAFNGDLDSARELYERAVALSPNESFARLEMANLYAYDDQPEKAIPLLTEALALDPLSPMIHNSLTLQYRSMRRYDEATEYMAKLRQIAPGSPMPWYRDAEVEFARGNWALAIQHTMKAMELDPHDPELATMIGDYYIALRMPGEAMAWYDRATEIDAAHPVSVAAPLVHYLYNDEHSKDGIDLARRYIEDGLSDRQNSRAYVLQVIWNDAIRNDSREQWLDYLSGYFPEFFDADGNWLVWSGATRWYMGAMLIDGGRQELGMAILQDFLDSSTSRAARYGDSVFHLWNVAAAGRRDDTVATLRTLTRTGQAPDDWPISIVNLRVFDFVRETPEYRDYVAMLETKAVEQQAELRKLLGTPNEKRGPI